MKNQLKNSVSSQKIAFGISQSETQPRKKTGQKKGTAHQTKFGLPQAEIKR